MGRDVDIHGSFTSYLLTILFCGGRGLNGFTRLD